MGLWGAPSSRTQRRQYWTPLLGFTDKISPQGPLIQEYWVSESQKEDSFVQKAWGEITLLKVIFTVYRTWGVTSTIWTNRWGVPKNCKSKCHLSFQKGQERWPGEVQDSQSHSHLCPWKGDGVSDSEGITIHIMTRRWTKVVIKCQSPGHLCSLPGYSRTPTKQSGNQARGFYFRPGGFRNCP